MGNLPSTNQFDSTELINLADMSMVNLPFSPSAENKTKYLYLSGNKFTSLPENMKNVATVDLSNNSMGPSFPIHLAKALSSYISLEYLELKKNQLVNLDNFENTNIEKINLLQNRFHELPDQFFDKYPKLNTVNIDCNFLKDFQNQSSSSIVTLSLSLNCIESIKTATLSFSQLSFLDLSKNQIKSIPNNFSKSFPQLQNLDLSDNFISEIPENNDDDLIFPTTLKSLNISNNLLEKIPGSITCLPNLLILLVENNNITSLPQLNQSLKKIKASNNKINYIAQQELKSLKDLDLSCNKISLFPTEIKMPKISTIILKRNQIKEINFNYIPINSILSTNVTVIDVSFNQIETIPKEIFTNLPNLHKFYAFYNKITSLPPEISNCNQLYALGISNNPIKKLPKLPRSLDRIIASNCEIDSIDSNIFVGPNTYSDIFLTHVDLSRNNIESFPTIPSIQILNLSQNKLTKLPSITEDLRILDVSMNQLESNSDSMPQFITGESITDLNLSYNKLTKVPEFEDVSLLQMLEMTGNPIEGTLDISVLPFLKRIDITETSISITGKNNYLKEIISSTKGFSLSPIKKNLYINQKKSQKENEKEVFSTKSGYSETIGLRNNMEDSIIIRDDLNLYCICDGHGGPETAKYASIRIAELFESRIKNNKYDFSFNKDKESFFANILNQTEKELREQNLDDGSTLCLASLYTNKETGKRKIVTVNLGDARSLIIRSNGESRELTKDQRPAMRSEFERIHNAFGKLSNDNRVDGILGVARSLGDFKVFGIGKKAEVEEFDIDDNDRYLVIGCDGVFDSLKNDEVAKIAIDASSPTEAAFMIRNAAFGTLSGDNISVIVVDLNEL